MSRHKTLVGTEIVLILRVPRGTYTVAVIGQGYKLVLEDGALVVGDDTPASYRAWNRIAVARCKSGSDCIQ